MDKLRLFERLSTILLLLFLTISCKKEPDGNKDIDLTDANIRVVKVEQLREVKYQPFKHGKYIFTYIYRDDKVQINFNCSNPLYNKEYALAIHKNGSKSINYGDIRNHYFSPLNPSAVWYPNSSHYVIEDGRISEIYDTVWSVISPITWQKEKGQFRSVQYAFNSFGMPTSITGSYSTSDVERWSTGKAFQIDIREYVNQQIKSYRVKRYLQPNGLSNIYHIYAGVSGLFVNEQTIANDLDVSVTYQYANGVPKMLITMLNYAILDLFPQVTSDYIFNYVTDLNIKSKVLSTFFPGLSLTSPGFADWIIGLCTNDLNILPEQNQLVYSKRIRGNKIEDIVEGKATLIAVDSTATFPYTHDPVAKTLEIAGLKIWYEVLD